MGACLFNVTLRPWEVMFVPLTNVPLGRIDEREVSPVCALFGFRALRLARNKGGSKSLRKPNPAPAKHPDVREFRATIMH